MTRRRVTLVVGMYSYLSSAGFAIINLLPHGLRIMLLGMLLGHLGKAPWIDRKTYFRYPWKITIGDNVGINRGCEFYPAFRTQGGTITIGDNVVLSPNVKIFTAGYDYAISTWHIVHVRLLSKIMCGLEQMPSFLAVLLLVRVRLSVPGLS